MNGLTAYALAKNYADQVATGSSVTVPTKTSDLQNDSGFITNSELDTAVDSALSEAKASGEFKGDKGKDGTSITVSKVEENTADSGSNVVTFSDGKTLTVKNGSKGSTGATGKSVSGISLVKDVDGNITGGAITFSDGSTSPLTITIEEVGE